MGAGGAANCVLLFHRCWAPLWEPVGAILGTDPFFKTVSLVPPHVYKD